MKNFNSCLFPIFQELYDAIIMRREYPVFDWVDHLKHFTESLNKSTSAKSTSADNIRSAVCAALKESDTCNLCTDCQKCSKRFYLAIAKALLEDYDKSDFCTEEEKLNSEYGSISFRKVPQQLRNHIESHTTMHQYYSQQADEYKRHKSVVNKLIMLKGMSSSSPYIYNNVYNNHYTGGGFYININGFGIAVDPGYGFVENMHKNKISIHDINAVIITHFHIDHTNDMRIIDDLNYQFNKGKEIPTIKWYLDETSHDTLYKGFCEETNTPTVITTDKFGSDISIYEGIVLRPFHTNHVKNRDRSIKTEGVYKTDTFGFTLDCTVDGNRFRVGYTSDTSYHAELIENLEGCDILIANISGIYIHDYLLIKKKDNHLGYFGCYKLLYELHNKPKIAIISEFWNGTTDMRFDVCSTLSAECDDHIKVLPGEIGMCVDVTQLRIKCSQCGTFESLENIQTIRPYEDFDKIMYVCKKCIY